MLHFRFCVLFCAQLVFGLLFTAVMAAPGQAGFTIFSAGGNASTASIQPTVDAFRLALGDPNNGNTPGPLAGGRREINWDGGGATMATPVGTPMTTFQNNRGGTFTTPGTGFLQTPLNDLALTTINPTYETTFATFSASRLFTPIGSNVMDATFSVPGTNGAVPATVAGFGAVFSDVDLSNTTSIELFDLGNNSLQVINIPPGSVPSASLSFAGAVANAGEQIARVRIVTGNSALGPSDSNGNPIDVVVMDDFLYSEPVPEPVGLSLIFAGFLAWSIRQTIKSKN